MAVSGNKVATVIPTPLQFTRAFRKLFFDNYLLHSNGNCSADVDAILVGYKKTAKNAQEDKEEDTYEVALPFQIMSLTTSSPQSRKTY